MTRNAIFQNTWLLASAAILAATSARNLNFVLTASFSVASVLAASAQSFYNLDFEQARSIPLHWFTHHHHFWRSCEGLLT